jgi:hypothetical protein
MIVERSIDNQSPMNPSPQVNDAVCTEMSFIPNFIYLSDTSMEEKVAPAEEARLLRGQLVHKKDLIEVIGIPFPSSMTIPRLEAMIASTPGAEARLRELVEITEFIKTDQEGLESFTMHSVIVAQDSV